MEKPKNNSLVFELTIISAESLSLTKTRPVKKNVFVIIKTNSNNSQTTTMDTENGSYPSWNQKFLTELSMHAKFFTLEVHCNNFSGDRVVGSARVPVSDFSNGYLPSDYLHFLSYRLRDRYGERNGIINLSIKVKSSSSNTANNRISSIPTTYSLKTNGCNYGATMNQNVTHGVAIGVPIQNRY
ncbi:unnamed protein product [Lactuca saligna]|uniref:C2 domain-containing protein n=1 Tax=Lactuca saligna TaxID=75948 RepID=A0AA35YQ94_LACSI|nr:unnamed protein product [Lactuca saligna]